MSSYDFLAGCYDELTTDVGYPAWADYLEAHFRRKGLPGRTVLDLAWRDRFPHRGSWLAGGTR